MVKERKNIAVDNERLMNELRGDKTKLKEITNAFLKIHDLMGNLPLYLCIHLEGFMNSRISEGRSIDSKMMLLYDALTEEIIHTEWILEQLDKKQEA